MQAPCGNTYCTQREFMSGGRLEACVSQQQEEIYMGAPVMTTIAIKEVARPTEPRDEGYEIIVMGTRGQSTLDVVGLYL